MRMYGGLVPLVPSARVDDGVLDVVLLIEGMDPFQLAAHVAKVLAGQHEREANIHVCRARSIRIVSRDRPLPIQADGDLRGTTPAEVVVDPALSWPLLSRSRLSKATRQDQVPLGTGN